MGANRVHEHVRSSITREYSIQPGQRDRKRKSKQQSRPPVPGYRGGAQASSVFFIVLFIVKQFVSVHLLLGCARGLRPRRLFISYPRLLLHMFSMTPQLYGESFQALDGLGVTYEELLFYRQHHLTGKRVRLLTNRVC